jgi:hypothetical protein
MAYFVVQGRRRPGREESALVEPGPGGDDASADGSGDAASLPS